MSLNLSRTNHSNLCVSNCTWNITSTDVSHLCVTLQRSFQKNAAVPFASRILIIVMNSFFAIFAAFVNLLIMIALNKKGELKTAANLILNSMALSDFLVGLTVQPMSVVYHVLDIYNLESCKIKLINSFLGIFCVGASMFSAVMFAVDRCFAMMFPFGYQEHLIYKKYAAAIVSGWAFLLMSVLMTYFNIIQERALSISMSIAFYCCVLSICFCYIMIYREVKKKRQSVQFIPAIDNGIEMAGIGDKKNEESANTANGILDPPVVTTSDNLTTEMKQRKIMKISTISLKQRSRSYMVVAILSVFLFCYLPVTVVNAIAQNQVIRNQAIITANDWANFIVLLNSSINPVIYCIRVHQIRREVKRILKL